MKSLFTVTFLLGLTCIIRAQNPQLSSLSPADDATEVAIDANLSITFDEPVEINTVWTSGSQPIIRLRRLDTDWVIQSWLPSTSTSGMSADGSTLSIDPIDDLEEGLSYYIEISWKVIQDLEGNYFDGFIDKTTWNFATVEPDVTAPLATSTSPSDEGTYAPLSATGGIVFNESVQEGSGTVALYLADGTLLESISTGVSDGRLGQPAHFRITWDFDTQLEELTEYYILVSDGAYEDLAGNAFAGLGVGDLDFTSNDMPNVSSLSPADASTGVAVSSSVAVTFEGSVYAADPCGLILREFDTDAIVESFDLNTLDLGDGAGQFDDGTITVTPSTDLAEETKYYVTIEPSQSIRFNSNAEGTTELSTKTDWTFTTVAPDITAPTITSVTEIEDGVYENYTLRFTVNFSEPVVIDNSFNMFRLGIVSPVVQFNISGKIEQPTPSSITINYEGLRDNWSYYLYIDPLAITDASGNAFAGVTSNTAYRFLANWDQPEVISRTPQATAQQEIDSDIILEFDEDVLINGAFPHDVNALRLIITTDNSNIETFTKDQLQVSGSTIAIDKTVDLNLETTYAIIVPTGLIMAAADTTRFFDGYTNTSAWRFSTEYNYWDGSQWADGIPGNTDDVTFKADYTFTSDEVLEFNRIYIPSGVTLSIENNATLKHQSELESNGHIIIESGSSLNSQGSFSGNGGSSLTVKRNTTGGIGDGMYSFIGAPFYNYDFTIVSGDYKYSYNQNTNAYVDASGLNNMIAGRGYTLANNAYVEFVGVNPITDDVSIGVQKSGEDFGFNLVANPYTAAISYDALMAAEGPDGSGDITSTIYIWDDGGSGEKSQSDFITINTLGSVTGGSGRSDDFNGYIGVAQGFFVESTQSNTSLTFTDAMKVAGNNADANYFRTDADTYETVKISLTNAEGFRSEILVGWIADALSDYDIKYDSRKLNGNNASQLYMPLGLRTLAIQGVPQEHEGKIELAVDLKETGEYSLSMVELSTNKTVVLFDRKQDVSHNLAHGPYTFYSQEGVFEDRFELHFNASILSNELKDQTIIYAHDSWLTINQTSSKLKTYRMVSVSGQEVWKGEVTGSFTKNFSSLPQGVYIVTDGEQSQKVILK